MYYIPGADKLFLKKKRSVAAFLVGSEMRRGRIPHRRRCGEARWNFVKLLMTAWGLASRLKFQGVLATDEVLTHSQLGDWEYGPKAQGRLGWAGEKPSGIPDLH